MRFEVEVVSEELLPAMRSIVARKLRSDYGFKQAEIAERLGVTQPAVSQYMNRSRADQEILEKLKEDPQVELLLDEAASRAAKEQRFTDQLAQVVSTVKDKGLLKEEFADTEKIL
ncbi:MAG: transcriptional regulator [Candidatus Nanohaloarchaea archaeon]